MINVTSLDELTIDDLQHPAICNALTHCRTAIRYHGTKDVATARAHEARMLNLLRSVDCFVENLGLTGRHAIRTRTRWRASIKLGDVIVSERGFEQSTSVQNLFIYLRRVARRNTGLQHGRQTN